MLCFQLLSNFIFSSKKEKGELDKKTNGAQPVLPSLHSTSLEPNKNEFRKVKIKINKTYQGYDEKPDGEKMELLEIPQPPIIQVSSPQPSLTPPQPVQSQQNGGENAVTKLALPSPVFQEPRVSFGKIKIHENFFKRKIHLNFLFKFRCKLLQAQQIHTMKRRT